MMQMESHLRKRLNKLELRQWEERAFALTPGDARRLMEAKLDAVRRRLQAAMDSGEDEVPGVSAEQVAEMLRVHVEESGIRREKYENQSAAGG
jgi:hypothetical protein